ncbi:unnamed protein product [Adineta steineri]|uniref:Ig-like domain-containing protein n=1 Tax=Adineta steineri TaxID=433720 RepID=A0A818STY0_9BILA|nr:unnamed protein product [Adineta steineri]CAF3675385.1 unnamed protein product [Adineta steineri]
MSSVTILLIILINNIYQIISISQCDLLNIIDIQSAAYCHSLILRVQPIYLSEEILDNIVTRKVRIREVIKLPRNNNRQMKMNDIIIIRIDNDLDEMLDDSCWHLLRIDNADIILFLNETNMNEFDLRYPPVETTLRIRENIYAVMNYETYSPQVIIKTRVDKPFISNDYSLQCNARGNPIPRLLWSKNNQSYEYYPTSKQCKTPCRIYSIQNKYQSILYFQSLTNADSGVYVCRKSMYYYKSSDEICNNQYFGERCETNYDDILKKQNNAFHLFKSRFLTGSILILMAFILLLIAFLSCFLTINNRTKEKKKLTSKLIINHNKKSKSQIIEQINKPQIQKTLSSPIIQIVNNRSVSTNKSITSNNNLNFKNLNGYYVPRNTNEECYSLKIDQIEDINYETKTNHLILSEGYLEFYQPDAESGLIRPLTIPKDIPKRYTKYAPSQHRFLLPRPINRQ